MLYYFIQFILSLWSPHTTTHGQPEYCRQLVNFQLLFYFFLSKFITLNNILSCICALIHPSGLSELCYYIMLSFQTFSPLFTLCLSNDVFLVLDIIFALVVCFFFFFHNLSDNCRIFLFMNLCKCSV